MRKIVTFCAGLLLSVASLSAQTSFLSMPSDAVSTSMGGADMAYRVDGFSVVDNMASTATYDGEFMCGFSYMGYQPQYLDSDITTFGVFYKVNSKLSLGAYLLNEYLPKQNVIGSQGAVSGTFTPFGFSCGLGVAYNVLENLSVGVAVKFIGAKIYTNKQNSFAGNLSVNYKIKDGAIALSVDNIGIYNHDIDLMPTAEVAFLKKLINTDNHLLAAALNLGYVLSPKDASSPFGGVGLEYGYSGHYFVRGGYSYADPRKFTSDYISAGVGVNFFNVGLDFAYLFGTAETSPIKNSYIISVTYEF